jgi:hypothetical protein
VLLPVRPQASVQHEQRRMLALWGKQRTQARQGQQRAQA